MRSLTSVVKPLAPAALLRALTRHEPRSHWLVGLLLRSAGRLQMGRLTIVDEYGRGHCFEGERPGPEAELSIHRPAGIASVATRGLTGLGESYIRGDWSSSDPGTLLTVLAMNERAFHALLDERRVFRWIQNGLHRMRRNSRRGSRENIRAHYDIGNAFYARWLDAGMTYSGARFEHEDEPLEAAQVRKYRALLARLDPAPGDLILEIGCGWGGLAEVAARDFDCRVRGITLSKAQLEFARARIERAGLGERVELSLTDYRDVQGTFDHIVSIEMFEAVGEAYWPTFFRRIGELLAPGGGAALQVITIDEAMFSRYRERADFVQRYIFPGGLLPSPGAFATAARRAGLRVEDPRFHGRDYALTLRRWREAFDAGEVELGELGFDARFIRLWRFYLAYCEAGFRDHRLDLMETVLRVANR